MITRLLFIVNPVSGKKTITDHMIDILNLYCQKGLEVSVLITQYQGHATEYVKTNSQRFDRIVCAGGDGTINEVVSGLREACDYRTLLGYIPCGSTNDFASNFGLTGDVLESAERAVSDRIINLDSGVLNEHSFLYTAASTEETLHLRFCCHTASWLSACRDPSFPDSLHSQ